MVQRSVVTGVGGYLPDRIVTNDELDRVCIIDEGESSKRKFEWFVILSRGGCEASG